MLNNEKKQEIKQAMQQKNYPVLLSHVYFVADCELFIDLQNATKKILLKSAKLIDELIVECVDFNNIKHVVDVQRVFFNEK